MDGSGRPPQPTEVLDPSPVAATRPASQRAQWLSTATDLAQGLVDRDSSDPRYRRLLALCWRERFHLVRFASQRREAETALQRATDELERLVADYPLVVDYRYDLVETCLMAAGADWNPAVQRQRLERAVALAKGLVRQQPQVVGFQAILAQSHLRLGEHLRRVMQNTEAERNLREAVRLQQAVAESHPSTVSHQVRLALCRASLAEMLRYTNRRSESVRELQAAVVLLDALPANGDESGRYQRLRDMLRARLKAETE